MYFRVVGLSHLLYNINKSIRVKALCHIRAAASECKTFFRKRWFLRARGGHRVLAKSYAGFFDFYRQAVLLKAEFAFNEHHIINLWTKIDYIVCLFTGSLFE